MDLFTQILQDIGTELDLPLHTDKNHACKLVFDEKISIQLQLDTQEDRLIALATIATLPAGRFRSDVLFETLKANSFEDKTGHFAYVNATGSLVLFDLLKEEMLKSEKLIPFLGALFERAKLWKEALEAGRPAPQEEQPVPKNSSQMFGLR